MSINNSIAQVNDFTNVKLSIWNGEYLTVEKFQNGEPINVCSDTNSWKIINLKNKPAVFVSKDGGHYYNYFAISDSNNLCPNGFRIPSYFDFSSTKVELISSKEKRINSEFDLKLNLNGLLDNSDGAYVLPYKSSRDLYLATISKYKEAPDFYYTAAHFYDKGTYTKVEEWPFPKNSGLPVVCHLDIDNISTDLFFDYKKLLPDFCPTLAGFWRDELKAVLPNSGEFEIKMLVQGGINSDFEGNIFAFVKQPEMIFGNIRDLTLFRNKLEGTLRAQNEVPQYHGKYLQAKSNLNFIFHVQRSDKNENFNTIKFKSKTLNSMDYTYAEDNNFEAQVKRYQVSIKDSDDGTVYLNEERLSVSHFKSRGPVYSLAGIVPGLGINMLRSNANREPTLIRFLERFIPITAAILAGTSLTTKLISNKYYADYRSNPLSDGSNTIYTKANKLHHSSLLTLGGVGLMSFTDIALTFSLGLKNKKIQKRLNRLETLEIN